MTEEQKDEEIKVSDEPIKNIDYKTTRKRKINLPLTLSVILALVLLINIGLIANVNKVLSKTIEEQKEKNKPSEISLTILKNSNCRDCFDINKIVETIKSNNVKIIEEKELEYNSEEARNLISKYNIEKIPTILVFGQIDITGDMGLINKEDALVFEDLQPVYLDLYVNKEVGRVTSTYIKDSSCKDCSDLSSLITQLIRTGVLISKENTLEVNEAQDLIKKYNIMKIPTIIFSSDLGAYTQNSQILGIWQQIGSIEDDGSYIVREVPPPYKDLNANKVVGLVEAIYLNDKSCDKCYNVSLHKPILLRFGVFISKESTFDISSSEGKNLIDKYKIIKVPTILMNNEAIYYPSLIEAWKQVGSIESDNSYVFRNLDILQVPYKDLNTNKVVEPQQVQGG